MSDQQKTIKEKIQLSGVGLHTGIQCNLSILPAAENHGLVFQRVDLEDQPIIEALVSNVSTTERSTSLKKGEAEIHTTEHVLAALYGMAIDNALIQMDAAEVPILDGSSKPFVDAINAVGIEDQNAPKDYFTINKNLYYEDENGYSEMMAVRTPGEEFRLTVMVDYGSKILGTQHASMYHLGEFEKEISPNRTFVFLKELEYLSKRGLIKGGDLNNAIVMVEREYSDGEIQHILKAIGREGMDVKVEGIGMLNVTNPHFDNEPARHKLLDIIGDLALVGRPIRGHILAARPGHKSNVEFARMLSQEMKKAEKNDYAALLTQVPAIDINQVSKMLPHRYPFLMVDKIIEMGEDSIVGLKNVTINEPFFQGHFPGNPVMPGVLQIEAMAQVGGIFALSKVEDPENYTTYFMKIDNVRFKKKVLPGDSIIFKLSLLSPIRRGIVHMEGKAYVGNEVCCQAEMMAQIVRDKVSEKETI